MQPNIKEMSVVEIKAMVYDNMALLEQTNSNIKILNDELKLRASIPVVIPETVENKE